ncbi:MAG TPA: hypothetical protein VD905_08905 [Flavobacteriales bacterium]|nr:hypothetical protein [Flavobacteriales bacterium]
MFKIATLFRNILIILIISNFYTRVTAQQPERCYGRDVIAKDSTIPCCAGLHRVHEVGTGHVYCDTEDTAEGRKTIKIFMIIFPCLLLVFALFGARNYYNRKKAERNKPERNWNETGTDEL